MYGVEHDMSPNPGTSIQRLIIITDLLNNNPLPRCLNFNNFIAEIFDYDFLARSIKLAWQTIFIVAIRWRLPRCCLQYCPRCCLWRLLRRFLSGLVFPLE